MGFLKGRFDCMFPLNVYLSQAGFRVDAFGEAVLLSNLDYKMCLKYLPL